MANQQLYLSIGVPVRFNAVMVGVLIAFVAGRISSVKETLRAEMREMTAKIRLDIRDMGDRRVYSK